MERMRELVQQSTSGSTDCGIGGADVEDVARHWLEFNGPLRAGPKTRRSAQSAPDEKPQNARRAGAGSRY